MCRCLQSNADASLLSGAINPTTVRQGLLGFNGRNLLQSVKVGALGRSLAPFTYCQLFLRGSMRGGMLSLPAICTAGSHITCEACLSKGRWWLVQGAADASIAAGYVNPTTVRQAILGFNSGRNLLQDPTVKVSLLQASRPAPFLPVFSCNNVWCSFLYSL